MEVIPHLIDFEESLCGAGLNVSLTCEYEPGEPQTDYPDGLSTAPTPDHYALVDVYVHQYWFGGVTPGPNREERPEWFELLDRIAHNYLEERWESGLGLDLRDKVYR